MAGRADSIAPDLLSLLFLYVFSWIVLSIAFGDDPGLLAPMLRVQS